MTIFQKSYMLRRSYRPKGCRDESCPSFVAGLMDERLRRQGTNRQQDAGSGSDRSGMSGAEMTTPGNSLSLRRRKSLGVLHSTSRSTGGAG
jgi:hypothetical protein